MPIKSYLAFTDKHKESEFESALSSIQCCDAIKGDRDNIYILVTETKTEQEENEIITTLNSISSIVSLALVGAWDE